MMSSVEGGRNAYAADAAFEWQRQIDVAVLDHIRDGKDNLENNHPDDRCADSGNRRKS